MTTLPLLRSRSEPIEPWNPYINYLFFFICHFTDKLHSSLAYSDEAQNL